MKKTALKIFEQQKNKGFYSISPWWSDSFEDEINDCIEHKRHSQVFAYM